MPKPETRLIVPDAHRPAHNRKAWKLLVGTAKDLQPDRIIIIGDFLNMTALDPHPRYRPDIRALKDDWKSGNEGLDELQNASPDSEVTYLQGNHEGWVGKYVAVHGELDGLLNVEDSLRLKERGILWVPLSRQRKAYRIGPVGYLHGAYEGATSSQNHANYLGPFVGARHLVHGHTHRLTSYTSAAGYTARCCGFLGDDSRAEFQKYMKGRPSGWALGFLVEEVCGDLVTDTEIRIIGSRALYDGKARAA